MIGKIKSCLKGEKGEVETAIGQPIYLTLFLLIFITFFTLILQNNQHTRYHSVLDDMTRAFLLKPMEEHGGYEPFMWEDFKDELRKRNIDPNKVQLVEATRYPVDRGEPVEVRITSHYEIRALGYIGGPILQRPTPVRRVGVSQRFFR
ncbi:MAG: DUF4320 family protein [Thermotaleaceae bacterium]